MPIHNAQMFMTNIIDVSDFLQTRTSSTNVKSHQLLTKPISYCTFMIKNVHDKKTDKNQ